MPAKSYDISRSIVFLEFNLRHIKYVTRYVNKLLEWGIKPIMIFDGSCLPSKKGTEQKRRE